MPLQPNFNADGIDAETFAPVVLVDCLQEEWSDVRLQVYDWDWLRERHGGDTVDDYYLNGHGVQGLVMACRLAAGLEVEPEGVDYNSEGDCCLVHFPTLEVALETAELTRAMLHDPKALKAMIALAREHDFDD